MVEVVSEEKLLEALVELAQEICDTPTKGNMEQTGQYSYRTYVDKFGSWNKALRTANIDISHPGSESGNEHYNWDGGINYYGPQWREKRGEALQRDEYECRVCERSRDQLINELEVHHITPIKHYREDDKYTKANELANLITLCTTCHSQYEGEYIFCTEDNWPPAMLREDF